MILNDNIKLIRELSGKTQKEFAKLIGIKLSNLKTYENTDVKAKMPVIVAVSELAGISTDDLQQKRLSHKNIKLQTKWDYKVDKDISDKIRNPDFDTLLHVMVTNFADLKKGHADIMNQHKFGRAELRAFVTMSAMKDVRNNPRKLEEIMEIYDKLLGETLAANEQRDNDYTDGR